MFIFGNSKQPRFYQNWLFFGIKEVIVKHKIINFIIIFITLILTLIILFYDPYKEYLAVYKDKLNIVYDMKQVQHFWNVEKHTDKHEWKYTLSNNNLNVSEENDGNYLITPNKDGITELEFVYTDGNENLYSIYYKFEVEGDKILWKEGKGSGLFSYPNPIK